MARLNVRKVVTPSPVAVGGPGGGVGSSGLGGGFQAGMYGLGRGLRDLLDPGWEKRKIEERVEAEESIRNKYRKDLEDHVKELKISTFKDILAIKEQKMREAKSASQAQAIARVALEGSAHMAALAQKISALGAASKSKDAFNTAVQLRMNASNREASELRARTQLKHQTFFHTTAKFEALMGAGADRDPGTAGFLRAYGVGQSIPSIMAGESAPTAPSRDQEVRNLVREFTGTAPMTGMSQRTQVPGTIPREALNSILGPAGPTPPEARSQLAKYFLPPGAGDKVAAAIDAAAGVGTVQDREAAMAKLSGRQFEVVNTALGAAETMLLYLGQGEGSATVPPEMLNDPDIGESVQGALSAWQKMEQPVSRDMRSAARRMAEDVGRIRAEFIRPSELDVARHRDDFIATLYEIQSERLAKGEAGREVRRSLATNYAGSLSSMIMLGGDTARMIDEFKTTGMRLTPEIVEALHSEVAGLTASWYSIGYGSGDINDVTNGNYPARLKEFAKVAYSMLPPELTDPETRSAFTVADTQARELDRYIKSIENLSAMVDSGKLSGREFMNSIRDKTGKLVSFTVGDDGSIVPEVDAEGNPVYLESKIGRSGTTLLRGAKIFGSRPEYALEDTLDAINEGLRSSGPMREPATAARARKAIETTEALQERIETTPPTTAPAVPSTEWMPSDTKVHDWIWDNDPIGDSSYGPGDQIGLGDDRYKREKFEEQRQRLMATRQGAGTTSTTPTPGTPAATGRPAPTPGQRQTLGSPTPGGPGAGAPFLEQMQKPGAQKPSRPETQPTKQPGTF